MAMWRSQTREEQTGFEHLTNYQLHQAMYRMLNQMVTRMYQQDQHQTLVCIFLPLHVPDNAQYRSVTCSVTRGCQKVLGNLVIVNICTNISSEWQTWPVYFKSESSLPNASRVQPLFLVNCLAPVPASQTLASGTETNDLHDTAICRTDSWKQRSCSFQIDRSNAYNVNLCHSLWEGRGWCGIMHVTSTSEI